MRDWLLLVIAMLILHFFHNIDLLTILLFVHSRYHLLYQLRILYRLLVYNFPKNKHINEYNSDDLNCLLNFPFSFMDMYLQNMAILVTAKLKGLVHFFLTNGVFLKSDTFHSEGRKFCINHFNFLRFTTHADRFKYYFWLLNN